MKPLPSPDVPGNTESRGQATTSSSAITGILHFVCPPYQHLTPAGSHQTASSELTSGTTAADHSLHGLPPALDARVRPDRDTAGSLSTGRSWRQASWGKNCGNKPNLSFACNTPPAKQTQSKPNQTQFSSEPTQVLRGKRFRT